MRNKISKYLAFILSMPFAILLLIWLAIISAIGSLVVQQLPAVRYVEQFGPFWARLFELMGLMRFYRSPVFIGITTLLLISTVLCLLKRGHRLYQSFDRIGQKKARITRQFLVHHASFFMVHAALLFIVIGAIQDANVPYLLRNDSADALSLSDISFRGSIKVAQHSQPVNQLNLLQPVGKIQTIKLPFAITLDQFKIAYNDQYQVKGYTSYLSFFDHDGVFLFKKRVGVNQPVDYLDMRLYQNSMSFEGTTVTVRKHQLDASQASEVITLSLAQTTDSLSEKALSLIGYLAVNPSEKTKAAASKSPRWFSAVKKSDIEDLGPSIIFLAKDQQGNIREWHQLLTPVTIHNQAYWVLGMIENNDMQRWLIPALSDFSVTDILRFRYCIMDEDCREQQIDKMMHKVLKDPDIRESVKQTLRKDVSELVRLYAKEGLAGILQNLSHQMDAKEKAQTKDTLFALLYSLLQTFQNNSQTLTTEQMDAVLWSVSSLADYPSPVLLEPIIWQERYTSYIEVSHLKGQRWIYLGFLLFLSGFSLTLIKKKQVEST